MHLKQIVAKDINKQWLLNFSQIIFGSLLIALLAQVKIPLPFTPVPITMHTLAVLLLARFLGAKKATWAVFAYLGEISLGLPFLSGALSKPLALVGTNAGYLLGFIPLAFCAGWIFERKSFSSALAFFSLILCCFLTLAMGSLWLANFVGLKNAFNLGLIPFLPGEILKVMVVTSFFSKSLIK